ncbi:MAG: 1-(5-phosphoribosyl)-5-[Clostridia bacterium]|nr:1-(5-phosphoribosyl)-5-[(5-phosphoribosylamino)methylideneamino]imidazole-4-carboxamide isomerase [Clostridia bacterium]
MIILPAIDILGGKCVRLTKGEYGTAEKVAADPIETALGFEAAGAEFIHMVDLDGAREGSRVNSDIYTEVARKVHIPIEVGGGIRDMDTIDYYISKGIERVIIGSAALKNPPLVREAVAKYGDRIAVGIDALDGQVKTSGWLENSGADYIELAKEMEKSGAKYVIFTDISKDGTLTGPNLEQLKKLSEAVSMNIIASGGIRDIQNIRDLNAMNLYGAICGKSIYSGTLSLEEAIAVSQKSI